MILVTCEFFGKFLVPTVFSVSIDLDRDFLRRATVSLTPKRTIADTARDAVRHSNHPRSYCAPLHYGYADLMTEAVGWIS